MASGIHRGRCEESLSAFIRQFLPPRLDGEIGLAMRHDFFAGIGVLNDEVAGMAG
jgi:hypothetical protein